ncbi:MAG: hypothetical protein QHC65_17410 [Sphingomonas sp.]|nr:hypothetical protein [Sphingomonas sp.]MDX3886203.1 hypothetical protein [Sphingomonas sp.]
MKVIFKFEKSKVQQVLVSLVGALMLSAACVTAAVAPVRAAPIEAPRC